MNAVGGEDLVTIFRDVIARRRARMERREAKIRKALAAGKTVRETFGRHGDPELGSVEA